MPLEVILAEVEKYRRFGRHGLQQLGLKARDLEHPRLPPAVQDHLRCRRPEVAAGRDSRAVLPQHVRHQFGDRALSVRTGDGRQQRIPPVTPREFQLRRNGDTARHGRAHDSRVRRHPGRHHRQTDPVEARLRVRTGIHLGALREIGENTGEFGFRAVVGRPHLGTVGGSQTCRRQTGSTQPDDQHPWGNLVRHRHLSFNVDNPARAKTTAMIQNLITTWVSAHPRSSKW